MVNISSRWMKTVRCSAKTDIGLRRANNQDSHVVVLAETARTWLDRGHLFIVADGMGAHAAGEVASQCATETISMSYSKRPKEYPPSALQQAVYDAHRQIREQSDRDEAFRDMGTTVDAMLMLPQGAVVAHVGDSRVYRWRNQVIEQLTFDHSLVWEVCVAGNLPFDQAPSYVPKNQITRSLGPTDKLRVDLEGPYEIEVGDVFLLCSDGLSGQLNDREIGQVLGVLSPDEATEALINLANLRGGPDNITTIVIQAVEATEPLEIAKKLPLTAVWSLVVTALSIVFVVLGLTMDNMLPIAILAGAGALLAFGAFGVTAWDYFSASSPFEVPTKPYGGGPYTSYPCPSSKEFTDKLLSILQQFRHVTQGNKWDIHWEKANAHEKVGDDACESKKYGLAIREYCLAINFLMNELKRQRNRNEHS